MPTVPSLGRSARALDFHGSRQEQAGDIQQGLRAGTAVHGDLRTHETGQPIVVLMRVRDDERDVLGPLATVQAWYVRQDALSNQFLHRAVLRQFKGRPLRPGQRHAHVQNEARSRSLQFNTGTADLTRATMNSELHEKLSYLARGGVASPFRDNAVGHTRADLSNGAGGWPVTTRSAAGAPSPCRATRKTSDTASELQPPGPPALDFSPKFLKKSD